MNDIAEVAASEQFAAIDMLAPLPGGGPVVVGLPISFDGVRPRPVRGAPVLGEHDGEVLGR